ncbi:enoyl-CoA hydratase-related protein [Nocardioides sp. NBC_00850]|uniref:enoyl-CoA hydratase/isomerase family protein n=1 Tax=Nocardioides sp. NBC_00850 TaxID=2976001 RepID=UPI0038666419|nr:enoyl-CoA hydratase-related protein [Nocardioides sp. NBC_00850]
MVSDDVLTDIADGVGTITLNRPDRRNALSDGMIEGLTLALKDMEASLDVGAIVLTGAGGAFCSGGDVQDFHEQGGEGAGSTEVDQVAVVQQRRDQEETVGRIYRCRKPVLASISGAVAGAGIGLALAADLRIGSPRTVFATAFGAVGLAGDYGVAWLLDRLVGPAKARELMFLNPRIRGEECLALGLINWVVPEEELELRTSEIAAQLANGPSHALDGMKQNLLRAPHEDLTTSMSVEVPLHKATGLTEDHVAAVRAFVAKEKPTFPIGWHGDTA